MSVNGCSLKGGVEAPTASALTDGRASCASHRFPKSRNGGKQARHSSKQRNRIEKVWMRFSMSCRLRAHTSTPWTQGEDDADALPGDA